FTVAFAILLFTILFGIANGLNNTFKEAFVDDAVNAIYINSGRTTKASKGLQAGRRIQFKNEDFDFLKEEFGDGIQYQTARIYLNVTASFRNENNNYTVRAVHPDHQYLENTKIKEGRYINQADLKNKTKVAIIGRLVEEDLYLTTKALGKYINLDGIQYKVVGIFTDDGGDNEERLIYIPVTTSQLLYGGNDYIDQINLTYKPEMDFNTAISFGRDIEKQMKERFFVADNDQRAIRVQNMAQANKDITQFQTVMAIIIFIIGLGTLIAGIVGISNIMIFIVKERTKEIGIRKAIGASPRSIISIILLEAIIITAITGYIGLLIGVGILEWATPVLEENFITNPGIRTSLVISATITLIAAGTLAGYLPAKRAARIKPIVALRNE
ncbi:MAG: ABC transporter permease, partial [Bacteroidia bacterium]|nr:ABC transporter permease [Bacteroidia bacterium]